MEFEIKDIQMVDSAGSEETKKSKEEFTGQQIKATNSAILAELTKENEELQDKLKLNYRRLLLFETENTKLSEEKNKLFFEAQTHIQKNQILTERNEALENQAILSEKNQNLLAEKISSYEKINATQLAEIKRFAKFHQKIQDVVKPFIVQLKKQVADLKAELLQSQKLNANLTSTCKEMGKKYEIDMQQKTNELLSVTAEKNNMMQTYEEQIHSFSKEIVDLQSKNDDLSKEISRLKKAVEFKNYFENEVIRFKRTHEEDQTKINELMQKKSNAEARNLSLEQELSEAKASVLAANNRMSDLETNLEVTRTQLSKKIDEIDVANERLSRLEKLNNQLSQQMSSK